MGDYMYLNPTSCSSIYEYIAIRTIQTAVRDFLTALKKANNSLEDIKAGKEVKKARANIERQEKKMGEIEEYFRCDPNNIFLSMDVDSEEMFAYIKRKLGVNTKSFKADIKEIDALLNKLELVYELVEEENGQYTFVFAE
ncbi:MAG: hypothetical protein IK121_07355 [Lachnospiraceae bacterium]|nr:hypothetical protein [Lachnospiraceae bacterium]